MINKMGKVFAHKSLNILSTVQQLVYEKKIVLKVF